MYQHIKERLWALVEDRNFTFLNTSRTDAEAYLDKFRVFEGLSEDEVAAIEVELNYRFPEDFREYLKTFGKKGGRLFEIDTSLKVDEMVNEQTMEKERLKSEDITDFFKEGAVAFYQHQGYVFCCFHKNKKGKTGIYYYVDSPKGTRLPYKLYNNFMEMMEIEMKLIEHRHQAIKRGGGYYVRVVEGGRGVEYIIPSGAVITPRETKDFFSD